jgi:hypothetical protein
VGALGWAVMSGTSPRQIASLSGGVFNTFGKLAGITTPIIIGYLLTHSGSFAAALVFVGANALLAIVCYLLVGGESRRLELKPAWRLASSRGEPGPARRRWSRYRPIFTSLAWISSASIQSALISLA